VSVVEQGPVQYPVLLAGQEVIEPAPPWVHDVALVAGLALDEPVAVPAEEVLHLLGPGKLEEVPVMIGPPEQPLLLDVEHWDVVDDAAPAVPHLVSGKGEPNGSMISLDVEVLAEGVVREGPEVPLITPGTEVVQSLPVQLPGPPPWPLFGTNRGKGDELHPVAVVLAQAFLVDERLRTHRTSPIRCSPKDVKR